MLRISKKLDYALIILAHLGRERAGRLLSARAIAAEYGLPLPVTSGILKTLTAAGLVASERGVLGGHRIALKPSAITFGMIAEAIEGKILLADCACAPAKKYPCSYFQRCPVRHPLRKIHREVQRVFSETTLDDFCRPAPAPVMKPRRVKSAGWSGREASL